MATQQEIKTALELFHRCKPQIRLDELRRQEMGIFAVIKYLNDAPETVNSVELCNFLGVSSARMAVLLKKLESKGLIVKKSSKTDARSKIVILSEKGKKLAEIIKSQMQETVGKIVDEFGLEKLENMFSDLQKIKTIVDSTSFLHMEELND